MSKRAVLVALACALALACGRPEPVGPKASPPGVPPTSFEYLFPKPGEDGQLACPMGLPDVHVTSIPTDSGSLLAFTSEQNLSALRRRARALSEELTGGELAGVRTTARYDEIPHGATVEVMAEARDQALALQGELEQIVREMQRERQCPRELIALG
jgi:hypothetical protein